jgi:hypothetical protein
MWLRWSMSAHQETSRQKLCGYTSLESPFGHGDSMRQFPIVALERDTYISRQTLMAYTYIYESLEEKPRDGLLLRHGELLQTFEVP